MSSSTKNHTDYYSNVICPHCDRPIRHADDDITLWLHTLCHMECINVRVLPSTPLPGQEAAAQK